MSIFVYGFAFMLCMCMRICYACIPCVCVYAMHICTYMCVYAMHVCVFICVNVCLYVCMLCIFFCMCAREYVMHICVCMGLYMHTCYCLCMQCIYETVCVCYAYMRLNVYAMRICNCMPICILCLHASVMYVSGCLYEEQSGAQEHLTIPPLILFSTQMKKFDRSICNLMAGGM